MKIQWHQVFDDALRVNDAIVVALVAGAYIGRKPTRSELSAARRAANTYATKSNMQVLHVAANRADGRSTRVLLLARPDADLDDTERLHAIASGLAAVPRRHGRRQQSIESLVSAVVKTSRSARRVDIGDLDREHIPTLSNDLAAALNDLSRLQDRLQRQARRSVRVKDAVRYTSDRHAPSD